MLQLMKYRALGLLRDKTTMFWSLLFPLILCTLFYVTFGNIDNNLECIDTAVVVKSEEKEAKAFGSFLKLIADSEEDLISVEEMSEKEAKESLKDGKVFGIYYVDTEPELVVASAGVEESILKTLLESYERNVEIIQTVLKEKPENLLKVTSRISSSAMQTEYVKEATLGGKETDGMIQYFFSLIAMTCMFGCFLGMEAAITLQANVNPVGARRGIGAVSKIWQLFADFIVVCIFNIIDVIVLLVYMIGVLKIDISGDMGKILPVSVLGSIIGVSMGMLVGSVGRWKEGVKLAIMLSFSLGSSFLSGLMMSGIKGLIEEYCPLLNRINPASLISDAFYCVSIYWDPARYTRDVLSMAAWAVVFVLGSFLMIRRVRYDSI